MQRPLQSEYVPYAQVYIDQVLNGKFQVLLQQSTNEISNFFGDIPSQKHNYAYEVGKWTVKQVLQHIIDTDRVFSYRALVASRGDFSPLPSFDENDYASKAMVENRTMEELLAEFAAVRLSIAYLFQHMTDADSEFLGNGPSHPVSARALGYMIIGHALHHIKVVKERY